TKPDSCWRANRHRSSLRARSGSPRWAHTTAWKAESHSHCQGYVSSLGTVKPGSRQWAPSTERHEAARSSGATVPGPPADHPPSDPSPERPAAVPTCAILSFRLGLTDGVSIVADAWARALHTLGFDVVTVAGEGPVDRTVPGLALGATEPPTTAEVADALAGADLVVVE